MGIVYQARQLALNRVVALKMIRAGAYAGAEELDRFRTEAEAAARLHHPNLVQIFDVGEAEGQPYLVMEFVDGGSLAQKVAGRPQPARSSAALVEALARAIHAAHQRGLVHRDLKPANVLLTAAGTPKVNDFGLAKWIDGLSVPTAAGRTRTGAVLGTPSYMAPEQAAGKVREIGPAVDVYALGAILYELLTGRPPFLGETPLDTLVQVKTQEPVPPRRLQPRTPRDLDTSCLKCLQKEPAQRYATAEELAEDLGRFQAGEPIRARPVGYAGRLWRWCRRKPAVAGLTASLAAAFLLVLLLLGVWAWQYRQAQTATERDVTAALQEAWTLNGQGWGQADDPDRWQVTLQMAFSALKRAAGLLDSGRPTAALREQVRAACEELEEAQAHCQLAAELDRARMLRADAGVDVWPIHALLADYRALFQRHGLDISTGGWLKGHRLRERLRQALWEWKMRARDEVERERLTKLLEEADPAPASFRKRLWEGRRRQDRAALLQLEKELPRETSLPTVAFFELSVALRDVGAWEIGQQVLREGLARYPNDFWLHFELGLVLRDMGRPEEAARFLTAATVLRPRSALTHYNLGLVLNDLGKLDEALDAFRAAIDRDPESSRAHLRLGELLLQRQQFAKARQAVQEALKWLPEGDALRDRALALLQQCEAHLGPEEGAGGRRQEQ